MKSVPTARRGRRWRETARSTSVGARGRGRRERSAGSPTAARRDTPRVDGLDRVRRPVGSEVALARSARAPGRQPRPRSRRSTRARASATARRPGSSCRASWTSRCRSSRRPTTRTRRGGCSRRRAIRTASTPATSCRSRRSPAVRGGGEQAAGGRHPHAAAPDRARRLQRRLAREEAAGPLHGGSGNSGNAASRIAEFVHSKGRYADGGYPDIDELFLQQARERDPRRREAILHRIQQLTIDRVMFAPIMDLRALMAVGPRVADPAIDVVPMAFFPSWEDLRLKTP